MCGWGVGGLRSRDELFVNSLFSLTVRVFIHRVLITWYFKNHCVNCVHSVVKNNPSRKAVAKNWKLYANLLFFSNFVSNQGHSKELHCL